MATNTAPVTHLDASELGTKEYWDNYYQNDLDQDEDEDDEPVDPSDLESWFDDVGAPAKVLKYLTSTSFPLAPSSSGGSPDCSVLDLGTGNGSMLISLRLEGGYGGLMVGVDYSQQSIDLARKLWKQYSNHEDEPGSIQFEKTDLIRDDPCQQTWWIDQGFDLVLDKGTFDAVSLSSESIDDGHGRQVRICELYPARAASMVKLGGYLLVTSCNWTEDEIIRWFLPGDQIQGQLKLYGKIEYPVYEFGGHKGQGVASVCFRKIGK